MSERATPTIPATPRERRWASADLVVASACLALSTMGFAMACYAFLLRVAGKTVHPDAILLPFAFAIPPAIAGGFFLLARTAMRNRTASRWVVQWGALLAPLLFAGFVWLSL